MRKKINSLILILLSLQAISLAQGKDTLVLISVKKVAFCNSKIEQVVSLEQLVENNRTQIIKLEERVTTKEEEIASYGRSVKFLNDQLHISHTETSITRQELNEVKNENKKLRKKLVIHKVGVTALVIFTGYLIAKD